VPELNYFNNDKNSEGVTSKSCNDICPDQQLSLINPICHGATLQAKDQDRCELNRGHKAEIETIVVGEFENQPILSNALRPCTDVGCSIGWIENAEITMAKRTPVSILINLNSHYSSLMSSNQQGSNIKAVVTLIAIGTICWMAAGVVAIAAGAESKIIWTCVVGAALGAIGIRYSIRRSRRAGI
jgi:hypothetical protein